MVVSYLHHFFLIFMCVMVPNTLVPFVQVLFFFHIFVCMLVPWSRWYALTNLYQKNYYPLSLSSMPCVHNIYVPWSRCHTLTNLFGTIQYVSLSKCIYYNKRHYKYDPLYRFLFKRYYPVPSNTQNTWFIYNMEMEKRRGRDGTNPIVPVPKKKFNNTSQKLKVLLRGALLITQITKNSHKKNTKDPTTD